MERLQDGRVYRVSSRGQVSLPAATRHRWGIVDGGQIEVFDLGECAVMLPVGASSARRSLARSLTARRYAEHVSRINDPDLRDE
jgi:bifunctional DNA-binding transcriptional regulator/antitoxin component of YhaV-PrlF toxin-antitoxin module